MDIAKLEVTPLADGRRAMAEVTWDSRTRRRDDGRLVRIVFRHTYFLTLVKTRPRIFGCVATDEEAILKRHRLIWRSLLSRIRRVRRRQAGAGRTRRDVLSAP